MAREFKLPDLGSGLQEGQIVNWLVEVGQNVTTDDVLCEIETEKSVIEIPVPYAGTVKSLAVEVGEVVEVGTALATFETGGASSEQAAEAATPEAEKADLVSAAPAVEQKTSTAGRVRAMLRFVALRNSTELT